MKKDLTGQKFGRLTVIKENPEPYRSPKNKPTRRWDCICDCGNKITVLQNALTSGDTTSCGCLVKEKISKSKYDLTGRKFGMLTVIKKADLPKEYASGSKHGWLCRCECGSERVYETRALVNRQILSCGCLTSKKAENRIKKEEDNVLKHYKGTTITTIQPKRKPNKNNTSGYKGVYWNKKEQKWIAKIGFKNKTITLGRFDDIKDAIEARKRGEEKYFKPILEEYNQEQKK